MSSVRLRAIRGATTVEADTADAIYPRVQELISELVRRNGLAHEDLVSIFFTATPDLTSVFPATAAREIGYGDVPLICATEINVVGATAKCVRVMVQTYTERGRDEIHHTYLHGAQGLRDDLPE
jgi:chorismate mutase